MSQLPAILIPARIDGKQAAIEIDYTPERVVEAFITFLETVPVVIESLPEDQVEPLAKRVTAALENVDQRLEAIIESQQD